MKNFSPIDATYMRKALALAARSRAQVHPNPMVGCLIVNRNTVVGSGSHEYFGGPHAEINALAAARGRARGSTLYVTLEPCGHWGKTPPCTEAIIKAGISRVVAAMPDPNPRVSGRGFAGLAAHGIEVVSGVLERQARKLNIDYIRSFDRNRGSEVTVKAAMTLDGKIATKTGDSKWITGPRSRALAHRIRSEHDAVVVGIGTVIADNPRLTAHGCGRNPIRVIIDPDLRIPLGSHVLDDQAPKAIIYATRTGAAKAARLKAAGAIMIPLAKKGKQIPFASIVRSLEDLSIFRILVEGGGETIASALESGLVNRVAFFIAPLLVGGRDAKTPFEGSGIERISRALALTGVTTRRIGQDLLVTANLKRSKHVYRHY